MVSNAEKTVWGTKFNKTTTYSRNGDTRYYINEATSTFSKTVRLYVFIMSRTHFRVNPHSIVA